MTPETKQGVAMHTLTATDYDQGTLVAEMTFRDFQLEGKPADGILTAEAKNEVTHQGWRGIYKVFLYTNTKDTLERLRLEAKYSQNARVINCVEKPPGKEWEIEGRVRYGSNSQYYFLLGHRPLEQHPGTVLRAVAIHFLGNKPSIVVRLYTVPKREVKTQDLKHSEA